MSIGSLAHFPPQTPERSQSLVDAPDCLINPPKSLPADRLAAEIPYDAVAVGLRIQNAITAAVYGPRSRR